VTPEQRLREIKHIVVLMMENRSFDHMLGYLKRSRMPEVRGLERNEFNLDPLGDKHLVHAFDASKKKVQRKGEALQENLDPDHSPDGVREQIGTKMDGFVKNYVATRRTDKGKPDTDFPRELWNVPMGYYTGKDLPVYDHLARNYCVCDAWHASVPGNTWPNRLYALTGGESNKIWKRSKFVDKLTSLPGLKEVRRFPLYDRKAFTHHLHDRDWRWYSHDPATLRGADESYRDLDDLKQGNFAWFDRRQLNRLTLLLEERVLDIVAKDSFLDDAPKGELRRLSWIDPNFVDVDVLDPHSNDDHPPADILAGQQLVFDVYDALIKSPGWQDTVLVVTYDEHGGFYDHVVPPKVRDTNGTHATLGVRVPALIVGPRVRKFVCHEAPNGEAFDHTALIRSILIAFADDPKEAIRKMGGRVAGRKAHIGHTLQDAPRTDLPTEAAKPEERLRQWREEARAARLAAERGQPSIAPDGAGQPFVLTDFQRDFVKFASAMRMAGMSGT
jgi:phospholipase C